MPQSMCPLILSNRYNLDCDSSQRVLKLLDSLHLCLVNLAVFHLGDNSLKIHQGLSSDRLLEFQVQSEEPGAISDPLDIGDDVTNLLDSVHLLHHKLLLDKVGEVEVILLRSNSLDLLQSLCHGLLQLKHCHHGLQGSAPVHPVGCTDVL